MNQSASQPVPQHILDVIYLTIDEANLQQDANRKLVKSPDTALSGSSGVLDSVGQINFIVQLEEQVQRSLGVTLSLASDMVFYSTDSPLRSVKLLADYLQSHLPPNATRPNE